VTAGKHCTADSTKDQDKSSKEFRKIFSHGAVLLLRVAGVYTRVKYGRS